MAKLRQDWREISKLRFFRWSILTGLLLLLAGVLLVWFNLFPAVETWRVVPLHYNIHIGVDKVGSWWELFVPSGIGLILTVGNMVLLSVYRNSSCVIQHFCDLDISFFKFSLKC